MKKLKPCPRCGGELKILEGFVPHDEPCTSKCSICGDVERHRAFGDLYVDDRENLLLDIVDGNPGALEFVFDAYRNFSITDRVLRRMLAHGIVGSKLYMLWNDCCDRDTALAISIADTRSISEIVEHINYENGRGIPFKDSGAAK